LPLAARWYARAARGATVRARRYSALDCSASDAAST
jgi:hypothetical protein